MKFITSLFICVSCFFVSYAQLPYTESFETDGLGTRYTADADIICNTTDYFGRADDTQINGGTDYSNEDGTTYWAGESLDDVVNGTPGTCSANNGQTTKNVFIGPINITGIAEIDVNALFGARQGTNWEGTEGISLSYSFDNINYTTGIFFEPVTTPDLEIREGGIESGTALSLAFANFGFSFSTGGATQLYLRITMTNEGSSEELAIDNIRVTEGASMPVELTSFKGEEESGDIKLSWQTASELNNDFFTLEHSVDGFQFSSVDKIQGKGTTLEENNYSFLHTKAQKGANFYRLKQTDFDGTIHYSDIINIEIKLKKKLNFYPNPSKGIVNILGNLEGQVKIFNHLGILVKEQTIINASIDLSGLSSGVYFMQFDSGPEILTNKIILQN